MPWGGIRFDQNGQNVQAVALFERITPDVANVVFFFSSRRRHTRLTCDWSSDVCSSDLLAIMAGFERCRGEQVVTLDADLQNPPEEIGKLLAKMDEGYDYVGGVRRTRRDPTL